MTEEQILASLSGQSSGSYCISISTEHLGCLSLAYMDNAAHCQTLIISAPLADGHVMCSDMRFLSLKSLIFSYSIGNDACLKQPVLPLLVKEDTLVMPGVAAAETAATGSMRSRFFVEAQAILQAERDIETQPIMP